MLCFVLTQKVLAHRKQTNKKTSLSSHILLWIAGRNWRTLSAVCLGVSSATSSLVILCFHVSRRWQCWFTCPTFPPASHHLIFTFLWALASRTTRHPLTVFRRPFQLPFSNWSQNHCIFRLFVVKHSISRSQNLSSGMWPHKLSKNLVA